MGGVIQALTRAARSNKVTALFVSLHPPSPQQLSHLWRELTQENCYYFVNSTPPPCFPEFHLSPTSVSYEFIFVESPKALMLWVKTAERLPKSVQD